MSKDIVSPTVLLVVFEQDKGDWLVKVPHAYGKGKHYKAIISDKLSLQFQPIELINEDGGKKAGVICYPLMEVKPPKSNLEKK